MKNVRWMTLGGIALVASLTIVGCTKKEEPAEAPAVEETAPAAPEAAAPAPATEAAAPATGAAAPATTPAAQ